MSSPSSDSIIDLVQERLNKFIDQGKSLPSCLVGFHIKDVGYYELNTQMDEPSFKKTDPDTSDEAQCTLTLSADNFEKMLTGALSPMVAYTMGKLKISGQTSVALKLTSLFDQKE